VALDAIFVIAELGGEAAQRIRDVHLRVDPKLAAMGPPHITIAGSSGVGPMRPVPLDVIRAALAPIAASTGVITAHFGVPMRFMQTTIIVLPLDPHGPLRALHERIATSGLEFERPRFPFTPHCTLSFYPAHPPDIIRKILAVRVPEPVIIDRLTVYHTMDPQPPTRLLELALTGPDAGVLA
jgi:2'-5' RNA ligase